MDSLRWEDTMRKCSADEKAQMGLGVTPQCMWNKLLQTSGAVLSGHETRYDAACGIKS